MLHQPEIESRANAWKAFMLPLHHWRVVPTKCFIYNIYTNHKHQEPRAVSDETFVIVIPNKKGATQPTQTKIANGGNYISTSAKPAQMYLGTILCHRRPCWESIKMSLLIIGRNLMKLPRDSHSLSSIHCQTPNIISILL